MRKILLILALVPILFSSCTKESVDSKIIALNFPSYDAVRAIMGDVDELTLLLPPGAETHHYEPTAKDMIMLSNASLVIYTGGESDSWVDDVLESLDKSVRTFKLIDQVDVIELEEKEGMTVEEEHEHEHAHGEEIDEHVWTSPKNEIAIINSLQSVLSDIYPERSDEFEKNAREYISELEALDRDFESVIESAEKNTLIFGSRFPLGYFVSEYSLDYYAAFPGCSEQTEPSASTVAFLIKKARELDIHYILDIEFGSPLIVKTIAEETDSETRVFNSMHNISEKDFNNGETYITLMRKNLEVIREVLN